MEREAAYQNVQKLGVVAWSVFGALLLLWASLWVSIRIAIIFPPLVLSVAIIYILNPAVSWLERRGFHRLLGSIIAYLAVVALLTLAAVLIVPVLVDQAGELADRFPQLTEDASSEITRIADNLGFSLDLSLPSGQEISDWFAEPGNQDLIRDQVGRVFDATLTVFQAVLVALVAPVLAFYMLIDLPSVARRSSDLIPRYWRDEVLYVFAELSRAVGGFVRGQLLVAFIVGVMTSVGFYIIDLPFWLLIGMISGFFNIIPFVGPWVAGGLGVVAGLTTGDPINALWAALVALIVQQIDNNFVSPVVLRATVRLHPALVLLALFAGAAVAGLFGVLIAVPTVAVIKILLGHVWRTRVLGQSWEEARHAAIEEGPPPSRRRLGMRKDASEQESDGEESIGVDNAE